MRNSAMSRAMRLVAVLLLVVVATGTSSSGRDLEQASLGFISLTASCVNCHRYLARARIAAARPLTPPPGRSTRRTPT